MARECRRSITFSKYLDLDKFKGKFTNLGAIESQLESFSHSLTLDNYL